MIALSWILFALAALLWTGAAWIVAAGAEWASAALASGTAAQAARDLAALPLPEWMKVWIDPAWLQSLQAAAQWTFEAAGASLPLAGEAAGWLVPAIWVGWGLGLAMLVAVAAAVHWLLRRWTRGQTTSPEW